MRGLTKPPPGARIAVAPGARIAVAPGARIAVAPGARIAIVGACGGIGRAVVAALREAGLAPVVMDLPAVLDEPGGVPIDVHDPGSVNQAFAGIGPLQGLVNLAGFASARHAVAQTVPAAWDEVLDANLTGAFRVAQAALPALHAGAPSSLVHVASGLAARLMPGYGPYGAAKAGLIALTKSIAVENAPAVRANVVAPGAVRTAFLDGGTGRASTGTRLDEEAYLRTVPMGRLAEPADVAGPILFLLSAASGYMTGQVLWVNGGALTP